MPTEPLVDHLCPQPVSAFFLVALTERVVREKAKAEVARRPWKGRSDLALVSPFHKYKYRRKPSEAGK